MPNRIWTKEEDNIIIREREARTAVPAIAAMLDRPVPATYLRARKLGTLVQPHKAASEEEKRIVRALAERDPPATDNEIAAAIGRTAGSVRWLLRVMGLVNSRDFSAMVRHANKERAQARPAADKEAARIAAAEAKAARREAVRLAKDAERQAAVVARAEEARVRKLARQHDLAQERLARQEAAAAVKEARAQAAFEAREAKSREAMAARAEKAALAAAGRARQQAERAAAQAEVVAAREEARRVVRVAREQEKAQARARAVAKAAKAVASVVQAHASLNAVRGERPALAAEAAAPIVLYDPASRVSVVDKAAGTVVQTSGRGGWKQVFGAHRKLPRGPRVRARADDLALAEAAKDAIAAFIADRGVTRKVESPVELAIRKLRTRGYTVLGNGPGYTIDARHHLANDNELLRFAEQRGAA